MTDWIPGIIAAVIGAVGGAIVAWTTRNGTPLPSVEHSERVELERQKDVLYEALRALELEKSRMDPPAWEAEQQRLQVEAAQVLRALDQLATRLAAPGKGPDLVRTKHPQLVGAAWGAGVVLFAGAIWLGLQQNTAPRAEGGSVTGGAGGMASAPVEGGLSPEQEAELAMLESAAKANPTDWAAQNAWAHALLRVNKLMEAWKISETVVAQDAANPEARTHQGIVLLAIGETEMAVGVLDKVLETSPQFIEALTYRGLLHLRNGDKALAIALWRQAIAADPSQKDLLEPLIAMAEKAQIPPAAGSSGAPPSEGASSAPAADGPGLEGEVQISAELAATVPPGTILFVLARPAGVDRGPPAAAKRIPVESFPVKFKLGPGDSPMGGGLSGDLTITARIDRDGNPTTRSPDDLEGKSAVVQPGATGLVIQLQKPTP